MVRGLYISAGSMVANTKKLDVITNNLANINTNGYKKDIAVFQTFADQLAYRINDGQTPDATMGIGNIKYGTGLGEVFTVHKQGKLINTGMAGDLAIGNSDAAFFTIEFEDANGDIQLKYTRNGAFLVNANGELTTQDGYRVYGENGPIILNGQDFIVMADGTIVEDDIEVDRLLIKEFEDTTTLRKYGDNLIEATEQTQEVEFTGVVNQGFLEESNVNPIKEMIEMINVMRGYEANQKLLAAHDEMLDRAVNEIGMIR